MTAVAIPDADHSLAERFLRALTGDDNATVTFQTFDDNTTDGHKKDRALARILHGTLTECWNKLCDLQQRGAGVFVTVNITDGKGRKKQNIIGVRAFFADLDGCNDLPEFPLPPSVVVRTKHGWHIY